MRQVRRFTDEEDAILKRDGGATAVALAKVLGRHPTSVVSRQVALGLRVPNRSVRRFSVEDDQKIRSAAGSQSLYTLASRMGRKASSLYGRAKTLGLDFDPALRSARPRLRGGYVWVPFVVDGRRCWVQEHRLAMARHIGRRLHACERVHHIDLNGRNNDIDNLFLCSNESKHRAIHNRLERALGSPEVVQALLRMGALSFDKSAGEYRVHAERITVAL